MKNKWLKEIRQNQKVSLNIWLDYLSSENAIYPMWFKYYVFQGMLKLGKYNKEKEEFAKRTSSTVSPFIELNPEILGKIYDLLIKMINKKTMTEEEFNILNNRNKVL